MFGAQADRLVSHLCDVGVPFYLERSGKLLSVPDFMASSGQDVIRLRMFALRGGAPKKQMKKQGQKNKLQVGLHQHSEETLSFCHICPNSVVLQRRGLGQTLINLMSTDKASKAYESK